MPALCPRMTDEWALAIVGEAARLCGVRPVQIMRNNQKRKPARARHGVVWVMKWMGFALVDIADHLGMSDHTSALWALHAANERRDVDDDFFTYTQALLQFAFSITPETDAETDAEAA